MAISKINSRSIADDAITSAKVADGVISAADVADGTLTNAKLADGTIENAKLADGTIENAKLAGSIANDKLANSSVTINGNSVSLGASASIAAGMFRNIIINGDAQIAQRSTSVASLTSTAYTYPTLDRWFFARTADCGTWTMSQSTDVPSGYGFAKSLKLDCTATASVSGTNTDLRIIQKFEGQNLQYLKYGSANAQSTTLSFWVKSTKTGTFIAELNSKDTRSISKSYTVSVSDTWEYKTITFAGDVSGVIDNDNSEELQVIFWLVAGTDFTSGTLNTSWGSMTNANRAVGQVNIGDNTANDFLITGVQLEAGTTASDFEFLPVDVNLQRCMRYYFKTQGLGSASKNFMNVVVQNGTDARGQFFRPTMMRAAPTFSASGSFEVLGQINQTITSAAQISLTDGGGVSFNQSALTVALDSSSTQGHNGILRASGDANAYFEFISEL